MKKTITLLAMAFCLNANAQTNQPLNDNHFWKQQVAHKPLVKTARLGGGINKPQSTVYLLDSTIAWHWDTIAMVLIKNWKDINFVYDANNNRSSDLIQVGGGTAFVNSVQYAYTYDANNNQTSWLRQNWSGTAWVNSQLNTYTYDVNNNQTSEIDQNWSSTAWVNISQRTYTYDVNNNQTSYLKQNWSSSVWVNTQLYTYTYDTHNILASELIQTWSGTAWVNYAYATTTTDVNNNIISVLIQAWSGSAWVSYAQNTYTYDAFNNNIGELDQNWSGSAYVNYEQFTYTHDANKNETSKLDQRWNTGTNAWVNYQQNANTFNGSNPQEISRVNKNWNTSHATEQPSTDSVYNYYRTVTTGINQLSVNNEQVSIYPNPVTTNLFIQTNEIIKTAKCVNNLGQIVDIKLENNTINVSALTEGMYFLNLTTQDGKTVMKKFIK